MNIKLQCWISIEDIALGTKMSPCWCPVARAIRRYFNANEIPYYNVEVNGDDIETVMAGHETHTLLMTQEMTDKVATFVERFDEGKSVEPFILEGELELFDDYDGSPRD